MNDEPEHVIRRVNPGRVGFRCPGCGEAHVLNVEGEGRPRWGWNGDLDRPTFTPSILARSVAIERDAEGRWTGEWIRDANGEPVPSVCHSFVTDGRIQFLTDCTHALAGQTVPLEPWRRGDDE